MAEVVAVISTVSAAVHLLNASLRIARATIHFIREAKEIDDEISRLLKTLVITELLLQIIKSTCENADSMEGDPGRLVTMTLRLCEDRLREVDTLVKSLASEKRTGPFHKLNLSRKIKSGRSKHRIHASIKDIHYMKGEILHAIQCWNFQISCAIRDKISHTPGVQLAQIDTTSLGEVAEDEAISPLARSFPTADTVCLPSSASRRSSTSTRNFIPSSSSPQIQQSPIQFTDDTVSAYEPDRYIEPQTKSSEWVDFYHDICDGRGNDIQAMREALQQHPDSYKLVNSVDRSQRTPLHLAAQSGNVALGKLLVEFKADINATDSQPRSVFDFAIEYNKDSDEFVEFLLENEVDQSKICKWNEETLEQIQQGMRLKDKMRKQSVDGPKADFEKPRRRWTLTAR